MIPVVALGQDAWLVPYSPNTDDACTVKARVAIQASRSLTARQSRRPTARLLRYRISWTSKMRRGDYAAARIAALNSQDEPILTPFWPAARPVAAAAAMTGGVVIAWTRGWTGWAISPVSLVGFDYYAPLLWGRFSQPPRITAQTNEYVTAEFSVDEDSGSAAAITPPAGADTTFATPDGYAAAIYPYKFDPADNIKLALPGYDVSRTQLGAGRQESTTFYPQIPEDTLQVAYKFRCSADAIELLSWWQRRAGGADAFWIPSTQSIGRLSADIAAGITVLPSTCAINTRVGDTLALCTTGQAMELGRVNSIAGGTVKLAAATTAAHPAAWTSICPAVLVRHTDDELQVDFRRTSEGDWTASGKVSFREVGAEYTVPTDGETRGVTMGRQPTLAWFARVDLNYPGSVQSWFLTDWEGGATTPDAQVWEYSDFDFGQIGQNINGDDDAATFKVRWWDGCPWVNWLPGQLSATGTLTVLKATVAADGTVGEPEQVWSGQLSTPSPEGAMLSVKVLGANALFDQNAPQQLQIPQCYKKLYGVRCALTLANWQFSAKVGSIAGLSVVINTIAALGSCAPAVMVGGLPAGFGFQDWFTLGYVEWTSGGNTLSSEIIASSALAGGAITLTLQRPVTFVAGATITVVPGCDRTRSTCDGYDAATNPTGKFNNNRGSTLKFGGFADMPAISPSFIIPQTTTTPAKK
ncbi:MAG TPA: phage BR0599 family protein [Opitutaceae bacterium]|jgi:hypothetical protein